jgi:hypothetical protein
MNLMIVIPPAHQALLTAAGWSKARLRARVWEQTAEARARVDYSKGWPKGFVAGRVMLQDIDNLLIIAAGGEGLPEARVFFPHAGSAITEPIGPPNLAEDIK